MPGVGGEYMSLLGGYYRALGTTECHFDRHTWGKHRKMWE